MSLGGNGDHPAQRFEVGRVEVHDLLAGQLESLIVEGSRNPHGVEELSDPAVSSEGLTL